MVVTQSGLTGVIVAYPVALDLKRDKGGVTPLYLPMEGASVRD